VPYHFVEDGLNLIKTGACEIAHGSRKLKGSQIIIPQAWPRRLTARMFRWLAICWLKIPAPLTDTQCGFKIYRGEVARKLYGECRARGFIFDIEIILRALRRGYRIQEFPITWTCDRDSRLSLTRSPAQIWRELQRLRHDITK
jgi:dolichyl-phosphate beta-glucosyltransferase